MSLDISQVVSELGDEAIGKAGEPLGLDKDKSVRVAHALAAHVGMGNQEMIAAAAADTGLSNEVVASMLKKLIDTGGKKLMDATGVSGAIDSAKENAMAALNSAGNDAVKNAGGFLSGLFGRK